MRAKFSFTLLLIFGLLTAPLLAWEEDVHYVLTFWLAEQAGFSREDAFAIAQADQEVDDSQYTSAIGSMIWVLTKGDKGAAESVKRLHFPSDALFPSPPLARVVEPNSQAARREAENCIKLDSAADALKRLGMGLHPLQDSWSHQGVPDTPLRPLLKLRPSLSSSHPESRGGWSVHDADLTHLHVTETVEAAHETYDLLLRYLKANPKRQDQPPKNWKALEKSVDEFARAATREEKNRWAVKNMPERKDIADQSKTLTLPGEPLPVGTVRYLKPPVTEKDSADPELESRASNFVKTWLVAGSPGAASEFVDINAIGKLFADAPGFDGDNRAASAATWVRKTLASYLAGNHAAINSAGHAMPGTAGYKDLPETVLKGPLEMRVLPDAALPTKKDLVEVRESDGTSSWILAVWRTDLPHDALALRWQKKNETWMVVELIPVVE